MTRSQHVKKRGVRWWATRLCAALILLFVLLIALNYSRIERLLAVNTLFDEEHIAHNFTHMDELFHTVSVTPPAPLKTHVWGEQPGPLPTTFTVEGEAMNLQDWLTQTRTTALLVVHRGKIVHESYPAGGDATERRISWSMSKSFLSALFGVAVADGQIKSLEDPVTDYVPLLKGSAYDGVPIRHVLNMASGVLFNEDYLDYDSDINRMGRVLALGGSLDEFAASLTERERESGVARQYVSIDTHVIGMVLRAATGKRIEEYFNEKLWSRLGIKESTYYVTDEEGVAFVLGGLNMRTRDYARFGQLFLQDGSWLGEQVIPRDWVRASTANSAPASPSDGMGYGYQWWVPKRAQDEFFAIGIYGQYIYVDRRTSVVVVKNSTHRAFRDDGAQGGSVRDTSIEAFRAIAAHYSPPGTPHESE